MRGERGNFLPRSFPAPLQEILKKVFATAGKWGAVGRFMGRPAPQRNLKKGWRSPGGEFSCPPAEVGGRRVAGRGSGRANGEVCTSSGSAAKPHFFTPFGHFRRSAAVAPRRAPCGCRAARRCRAAPFHGRSAAVRGRRFRAAPLSPLSPSAAFAACRSRGGPEGGKISIGRRPVCPVSFSFS